VEIKCQMGHLFTLGNVNCLRWMANHLGTITTGTMQNHLKVSEIVTEEYS